MACLDIYHLELAVYFCSVWYWGSLASENTLVSNKLLFGEIPVIFVASLSQGSMTNFDMNSLWSSDAIW